MAKTKIQRVPDSVMAQPNIFRLYDGATMIHMQWRPYLTLGILTFPWVGDTEHVTLWLCHSSQAANHHEVNNRCPYNHSASQAARAVKSPSANALDVRDLSLILEEDVVTHSSILVWEIPWTGEPGGLRSTGHKESDTTEVT